MKKIVLFEASGGGGALRLFKSILSYWKIFKICYNSDMKLHKYDIYKNGFTLAEVLVTLGIIGVVSAMTVPTLMQNHQRKTYVVQLHKVYNDFSQAALRYMTDRNALNLTEAGLTDINSADSFIKTYFKIVKD